MRVWIDQDLCTGDGLCVDLCPDVFVQLEDGIAYVAERGEPLNDPGGAGSLADVTVRDFSAVVVRVNASLLRSTTDLFVVVNYSHRNNRIER